MISVADSDGFLHFLPNETGSNEPAASRDFYGCVWKGSIRGILPGSAPQNGYRIKTAPFLCWSGKAEHFTRWPKRWGTVPIHVQYLLGGDFIHGFCKAIELECSWGFPGEPCRIAWHFWGPCPSNLNLPKRRRTPTPRALRNECMFWTCQILFCAAAGRVPLMCLSIKESLNLLDTPFRAPSPPVPLTSHTLDINVCSGRGHMWTEGTVMLSLLSWRENEDKPQ